MTKGATSPHFLFQPPSPSFSAIISFFLSPFSSVNTEFLTYSCIHSLVKKENEFVIDLTNGSENMKV